MSDTKHKIIIAVDGFSSCGKSTFAKAIAARLGYIFIDTGAMYRAIAWQALQNGVALDDEPALGEIARTYDIAFGHVEGDPVPRRVFIGDTEVTDAIRTAEIDRAVSPVSAAPAVREALLDQQRRIGNAGDYVVEGRDIGTVVFPDAELKLFMTADPAVRARRRYDELRAKGDDVSLEEIERNVRERDRADMSRAVSPLRQAPDAVVLDNSRMSVEEQMAWFMELFERRIAE